MKSIYLVSIFFLCVLNGKSQTIVSSTYILKTINQTVTNMSDSVPKNFKSSLKINKEKGYSAFSTCNSKSGQLVYTAGGLVEFSNGGQTKKYCADKNGGKTLMDFESKYFGMLAMVDRFEQTKDSLILITKDKYRLAFVKK